MFIAETEKINWELKTWGNGITFLVWKISESYGNQNLMAEEND